MAGTFSNEPSTQPPQAPQAFYPASTGSYYQVQPVPTIQIAYQHQPQYQDTPVFTVPKGRGFSYKTGHCFEKEIHTIEVTDTHVYIRKEDQGCVPRTRNTAVHVKDISTVEYNSRPYSLVAAYLLWLFFGVFGAHRFYVGKWRTGLLWFLTLGMFGLGWLVDMFCIPTWMKRSHLNLTVCGHYNKNLHIIVDSSVVTQIQDSITESQRKLYATHSQN
eukprot:TRINITY_DN542_c0_g1_i1.p1 TRINITY_DN542_c0_g1~~TRINITY_DN542_c0_g1_i1.p1  ORF type:complete len:217 (-),score=36.10 TRINITY_DN542_c0_g1_i1:146-796(-)